MKLLSLLVTPPWTPWGFHTASLSNRAAPAKLSSLLVPPNVDSVGLPHNHPLQSGRDCGAVVTFGHTTHGLRGASTLPPSPVGLRLRNCRHVWPRRPWTLWGFHAAALSNRVATAKLSSLLATPPMDSVGLPRSRPLLSGRDCEAVVTFDHDICGFRGASTQPRTPVGPRHAQKTTKCVLTC